MYGRLMLTFGVFVDGKCYHDHGIHTDPMGYLKLDLTDCPGFGHRETDRRHGPGRAIPTISSDEVCFSAVLVTAQPPPRYV